MTAKRALPAMEPLRVLTFPRLDGGLDLQELDYRVAANRSPEMKNLWWQDGVLQCRDGQVLFWSPEEEIRGFAMCREPFRGQLFFHAGSRLYRLDPAAGIPDPVVLAEDVPQNRGEFFPWGGHLYYKNRGGFYRMDDACGKAQKVEELAHVPTVLLNAEPGDPASGDAYQPVNRLSPLRRICFNAREGVSQYLLPVKAQSVTEVKVNGRVLDRTEYRLAGDRVQFTQCPAVPEPYENNTVEIVVSVPDAGARDSIMNCCHAAVSGGEVGLCFLLSGDGDAPHNVYWNGGDDEAMDPAYWPYEQYVHVGDAGDAVTGFGRQYGDLMVLKEHSLWRLEMSLREAEGRKRPGFAALPVNHQAGCDLPGTAALVENNLVFCTRQQGVFQVRSSSAAYETNIRCLSRRVNGGQARGLLRDLRESAAVTAFDDGSRYWLCADDHAYLWDYTVSDAADPSWFYLEGVCPVDLCRCDDGRLLHLDAAGRLTLFARVFSDYGRAIEKVYRFPALDFGTYDRLKNVDSVLLNLRADTAADVELRYEADGVARQEPVPIRCRVWRLVPRNLRYRSLRLSPFAHTARRRPCIRRIRHFAMTLRSAGVGCDLAIVSAQVFYRLADRQR